MSFIEKLIGPISGILDKVVADKDERARLAHEIATLAERNAHQVALAQSETNRIEAMHRNVFIAGWRPATGWCCCAGMAANYILFPMANFFLALAEVDVSMEPLDLEIMMPVLLGMLGLATNRTYEKVKGVSL